jgi:hypothetical protein
MRINLALWDRILRFTFGILLTAWAVAGGPWWAYFGVYLVMSAGWGFCIFYAMFKLRTAKNESRPMAPPE